MTNKLNEFYKSDIFCSFCIINEHKCIVWFYDVPSEGISEISYPILNRVMAVFHPNKIG